MSAEGWKTITLKDAGVSLIDCEHKTPSAKETGYPYVAIPQIKNGRIDLSGVRLINSEDYEVWTRKAKPKAHDVVLSRRCNPGETAVVPPDLEFALGQNLVLLRADGKKMFPPFLRWIVRGPEWREQIVKYLNTGAIFDSLKCVDIPNFKLSVPDLPTQTQIADILSALDDKVELNRRTNATLEDIAQSIFKKWFVDFRFPGVTGEMQDSELGAIPKGWRVGKVGEICEVNKNSISKKDVFEYIKYIEISEVTKGIVGKTSIYPYGTEPSRAKRKLKHGDTVLSTVRPNRGSYFLALNPPPNLIASTGFAIFSPTKVPPSFLYLFLTSSEKLEYYGHVADGGAYPAINPGLIMDIDIIIPDNDVLNLFLSVTDRLFQEIDNNHNQSTTLAQTRDTLLPKLMSGEIEV